jgi:hypothetical protein
MLQMLEIKFLIQGTDIYERKLLPLMLASYSSPLTIPVADVLLFFPKAINVNITCG